MYLRNKRVGKFFVARELLENPPDNFFNHFIIYHAEFVDFGRAMEYFAISELFEVVNEGEYPPEYTIICDMSGNISAQKVVNNYEKHLESNLAKCRKEIEKLKVENEELVNSYQKECSEMFEMLEKNQTLVRDLFGKEDAEYALYDFWTTNYKRFLEFKNKYGGEINV